MRAPRRSRRLALVVTEAGDDDALDRAAVLASLDEPARFGEVFERHHRRIWSYLARSADRDTADELAGDVFTTAFRARATYDPVVGSVRSWLYGIAANILRTRRRSEHRGARAVERVVAMAGPPSEAPSFEERLDAQVDVERVRAAVARLRADERVVVILSAWEELSYVEIAQALDLPVGTVRSRLFRGKEHLRRLLLADTGSEDPGVSRHRTAATDARSGPT